MTAQAIRAAAAVPSVTFAEFAAPDHRLDHPVHAQQQGKRRERQIPQAAHLGDAGHSDGRDSASRDQVGGGAPAHGTPFA
jgi:hypothetical protein